MEMSMIFNAIYDSQKNGSFLTTWNTKKTAQNLNEQHKNLEIALFDK